MLGLILASLSFFLLHRLVSGSRLRDTIASSIGEAAFQSVFSLASLACLTWLWFGYQEAKFSTSNFPLFPAPPGVHWIAAALQFVATLLIVAGLSTRNPTIAGLAGTVRKHDIVRGILRVTRHPFLWGISIFSAGHMLVLTDAASWGFFGTLLLLALTGTVSIDIKRKRIWGRAWQSFADQTSNVPFGAILASRQPLRLNEIGLLRFLISIIVYAVLAVIHPYLFGGIVWS